MLRILIILCAWLSVPVAWGQVASGAISSAVPDVVSGAQSPLQSVGRPALQDPVSFAMLGQLLVGLVIVIVAILLVLWLVKRFTGLGVQGRHLKVVAALPLGTREKAVLIDVGGKQLLLGVAPGRVSLLQRFDEPVVESDSSAGFGAKLRDALERKESQ